MGGGLTALSVIGFIIGIAAERLRSGSSTGLGAVGSNVADADTDAVTNEDTPWHGDASAECATARRGTAHAEVRTNSTWLRLLGPLLPRVRLYLWLEKNWPKTPPPPPGVSGPMPIPFVPPWDWVWDCAAGVVASPTLAVLGVVGPAPFV